MLTMGSLFDGIGGFPLASSRNGITPIWASEVEKFPIEVTKIRFPDMEHLGDIKKLKGEDVPPVDIICGGSPCQAFSVASCERTGLESERSGLFIEQVRLIKEMRIADEKRGRANEFIRPRYMVWENVPGVFSCNKGEDFKTILQEIVNIKTDGFSIPRPPNNKWLNAGAIMGDQFSLAWKLFQASEWGVPQSRRRIYLVADFGGSSAPKILFEQESLFGDN